MLKTGYQQPSLATPQPSGWEAGGPSSVSFIYQEVVFTSVCLGKQHRNQCLHHCVTNILMSHQASLSVNVSLFTVCKAGYMT